MAIRRPTYEQSAVSLFLDFELPRMMATSASAERERQHEIRMQEESNKAQLLSNQLNMAQRKKTELEDKFIDKGLSLPSEYKTNAATDLFKDLIGDSKSTVEYLNRELYNSLNSISYMGDQLAQHRAGELFAGEMEKHYADLVPDEDDEFNKYMISGDFEQGEDGKWKAKEDTELEKALEELSGDDVARFQGDAFRKGFQLGRINESQAKALATNDLAYISSELNNEKARKEIENQDYQNASIRLKDASNDIAMSMKNYGNMFAGQLNIGGTWYAFIDLLDPNKQIATFESFKEMYEDGDIEESVYLKVNTSINALRKAAVTGDPDDTPQRYFIDMASQAYDDVSLYNTYAAEVKAGTRDINDEDYIEYYNKAISWKSVGLTDSNQLLEAKKLDVIYDNIQDTQRDLYLSEAGVPELNIEDIYDVSKYKKPYEKLDILDELLSEEGVEGNIRELELLRQGYTQAGLTNVADEAERLLEPLYHKQKIEDIHKSGQESGALRETDFLAEAQRIFSSQTGPNKLSLPQIIEGLRKEVETKDLLEGLENPGFLKAFVGGL